MCFTSRQLLALEHLLDDLALDKSTAGCCTARTFTREADESSLPRVRRRTRLDTMMQRPRSLTWLLLADEKCVPKIITPSLLQLFSAFARSSPYGITLYNVQLSHTSQLCRPWLRRLSSVSASGRVIELSLPQRTYVEICREGRYAPINTNTPGDQLRCPALRTILRHVILKYGYRQLPANGNSTSLYYR